MSVDMSIKYCGYNKPELRLTPASLSLRASLI